MAARKQPRRFGSYAAMEAGNVFLIPGLALWLTRPTGVLEAAVIAAPILAVAAFLIIGALYWRSVDQALRGGGSAARNRALSLADGAEKPLLLLLALAALSSILGAVVLGPRAVVLAAAVLTLLAALEYVNYYHRQLQHFDNARDFKRLLTGRGLRRSHMARNLAAYRQR